MIEKDPAEENLAALGDARFDPAEEAALVSESNVHKSEANQLFSSGKYQSAITRYDEALSICPNYLDFELAVLKSNVAACYLKLEEWKDAIQSATDALSSLDKLDGVPKDEKDTTPKPGATEPGKPPGGGAEGDDEVEEEIVSIGASKAAPAPPMPETVEQIAQRKRAEDILRIRAKALMRRARARSEAGGWSNLAGAEDDYKTLMGMTCLGSADRKIVQTQLRVLPPRTKAAQEKEMGEMWGKLKDLGNGLLKPFGLSTNNFQMVKDENTGGYSMNFAQNPGK